MTDANSGRLPAPAFGPEHDQEIHRVSDLFREFKATRSTEGNVSQKLEFAGVDGQDVYNITAPFSSAGHRLIAGRVEARHQEISTAVFFEERRGVWHPLENAPRFDLQDPFFCIVRGELVFGGVRVHQIEADVLGWRTVFFRGRDIFHLEEFFVGPIGMKDIRLCDLQDGRIGVFTRPQGAKGGRGTIGYTQVASLDDLNVDVLDDAPLIENMFHPADWGGVNETHLLPDGQIGVLAHAAHFENDDPLRARHYYATAFTFDLRTRSFRDYRVIASRDQFPAGQAKRPDLKDVLFSSGLVRSREGTRLFAGLSDAEAHWIAIPDPF